MTQCRRPATLTSNLTQPIHQSRAGCPFPYVPDEVKALRDVRHAQGLSHPVAAAVVLRVPFPGAGTTLLAAFTGCDQAFATATLCSALAAADADVSTNELIASEIVSSRLWACAVAPPLHSPVAALGTGAAYVTGGRVVVGEARAAVRYDSQASQIVPGFGVGHPWWGGASAPGRSSSRRFGPQVLAASVSISSPHVWC